MFFLRFWKRTRDGLFAIFAELHQEDLVWSPVVNKEH